MQNESWNLDDELKKNPPPAVIWMKVESSLHLNNSFLPTLLEVIEVKVPRSRSVFNKSNPNQLSSQSQFQIIPAAELSAALHGCIWFSGARFGSKNFLYRGKGMFCVNFGIIVLCGESFRLKAWKWLGKVKMKNCKKSSVNIRVYHIRIRDIIFHFERYHIICFLR